MRLIIVFFLLKVGSAVRFRTSVNIKDSLDGGYRPGEIVELDDKWFEEFYKTSIPVTETSMKEANKV